MAKLPYSGSSLSQLLAQQNRGRARASTQKNNRQVADPAVFPVLQEGIELQKKGNLGLAAQLYQKVLEKYPSHPDALHLLATVAMAGGQIGTAVGLLQRAVAGKPEDPSIRCNLASALMQVDDPESAEFHLRKALKAHPGFTAAQCFLADCRAVAGDRDGAIKIYEDVLARVPNEPQALIGCGDVCVSFGDIEKAQSLYRKALATGTNSALAVVGLATCERPRKGSPEAAEVVELLRKPGLRPMEYSSLSYIAGQIAEASGDYDEAFGYFASAKRLSATAFDMTIEKRGFETLKDVFTKSFFEQRKKFGSTSTRPIFVVGMPRSGTTLVEQILSRHPQTAAGGELGDMSRIAGSLGFERSDPKAVAQRVARLRPADVEALANRYLAVLRRISATAAKVTDKMPHNFLHLGLIALLFPKARIVHCRRDPIDNCVSCFTTQLKDQLHGYTLDLESLGAYYREYAAMMIHWHEVLPIEIYDLEYERLIDQPERESRSLIDFVGLPWDPACLSPHESESAVRTQSRMQVRQPIYRSSIGRWRRYEKHLGPLIAALGDLAVTSDRRAWRD